MSTARRERLFLSIKSFIDPPFDPTLVEHPAKLLDVLNKTERLQKLLTKKDDRGYTLLHLAAEKNQPESLKCLLIKEADPNIRSATGTNEVTPLHIASNCGHLACVQLLVQSGADIMSRDRKQLTPSDYANISGQDLCLNYLHDVIAQRQREEERDLEDVLMEVERNLAADNVQTLNHWTQFNELFPISMATPASHEYSQLESMMYRHCVLINNQNLVKIMGRVAKDIPVSLHDASLLHAACLYGRIELTKLLIHKFPEIMLTATFEGFHALHIAVAFRQLEIVKTLTQTQVLRVQNRYSRLSTGPGLMNESTYATVPTKFGAATLSGHTVLHFAVAMNDLSIMAELLKYHKELQLNVDACECGYTALHLAVYLNQFEAVDMLLQTRANLNTRLDPKRPDKVNLSFTPLAEAAVNNNHRILTLLLKHGADDKHHEALKVCHPSNQRHEMLIPLLGSLIHIDDSVKSNKQAVRKGHPRIRTATIDWSHLHLGEIHPSWIAGALPNSVFLQSQNIEPSKLFECVTSVTLCHNGLTELPVEIFKLPKLATLNASNNRLEILPDLEKTYSSKDDTYKWPCSCLSKVILSKNSLTFVPRFLFQLPNLSHLDLSHNHILKLPFDAWTAPKLYHFNCSHNQLEEIPTNWPRVLETFCVIDTTPQTQTQGSPNAKKKQATHRSTKTREIPKYLLPSDSRDDLDLKEEREGSGVPPVSRLQDRLNISNANLAIEWDAVESRAEVYEGLAILNLSDNRISMIPDNFACLCPKLIRLDLSFNRLTQISLPKSFPSSLKHINLAHNPLVNIDSEHTPAKPLPCTNPQVLNESENTIHLDHVTFCCHRQHTHLVSLGVLELNNCQLESVNFYSPAISLHKGKGKKHDSDPLMQAIVSANAGKRPQNVQVLARLVCPLLTRLILSHNNLMRVPDSVCHMTSLNSLDLSHNEIIELPADLGQLGNLWEFPLHGLKLISPPHNIIERGKTKDIIGFLWSLLQKARPYHRMKLMLVGKAARGKTTLLQRISEKGQRGIQENWALTRMMGHDKSKMNLSTVGIVVSDWTYYKKVKESQTSLKSITFMTWDFGGQEEYYATHQCFLSRRSLYLLVWNVTHGVAGAEELKPWLLNIQARAPHSPVIIVGTHLDKVSSKRERIEMEESQRFIASTYGTADNRREGFPQIMLSSIVSCKSGKNINELRDSIFDIASQVKENTVAGRGIGCGRIPEHRLLMDQLVPASYLQLEDTVRNIALSMRMVGKPPVLTYKELRDAVFADPRTQISKNTADRELEQAVRFLHDNGTLLHYEDPLLSDFYFVDPQWLCDMLAHIVTVREINPFVREGVMRLADFRHIFSDEAFPIRWQREYIRLLTTFEVAVELGGEELLIPSTLPSHKPHLPQTMFPEDLKMLPPLRHTYIVPFIPSGFWPRLMSRILTDTTILQLARDGCGVTDEDVAQLSWVKWRTGLILQYGNLTLMTIEELTGGLFPGVEMEGIKILKDDKWELQRKNIKIFGIDVIVPDIYPILKFPETVQDKSTRRQKTESASSDIRSFESDSSHGNRVHSTTAVTLQIEASCYESGGSMEKSHDKSMESHDLSSESHDLSSESHDKSMESHDQPTTPVGVAPEDSESCVNKVVAIDEVDLEFEKLAKKRCRLFTTGIPLTKAPSQQSLTEGSSPKGNIRERYPSTASEERFRHASPKPKPKELPKIDEERNDMMRAGLLSKVVDHIALLIDEWFIGVRPRHLVAPCPHCTANLPHNATPLERSFSTNTAIQPKMERTTGATEGITASGMPRVPPARQPEHTPPLNRPRQRPSIRHALTSRIPRLLRKEKDQWEPRPSLCQDCYFYAFYYDNCVITARTLDSMFCPAHGNVLLQYMAPDTLFLTQGKDILMNPYDLVKEDSIGQGAFATVFKGKVKRTDREGGDTFLPVALKALTKEWKLVGSRESTETDTAPDQEAPTKLPSRHSILEGFRNLKKELSILSPLKHPHVIQLFGVMLRPLGLVLELAPKGSLKAILQSYAETQLHLPCNVAQAVVIQVASAIQYLHSCSIIYRDLKSDNVLVWQFPDPQDSIPSFGRLGMETVLVKLSDYGISQFAATQGARGLVGTPGFMAPEIIKYHGREVYTEQVDIFSFGMFVYEMISYRIPFENLTAPQANQANERGVRPPLTKKDLPCPLLLRELMVWCWQQHPDDRPTAPKIIAGTTTEQFLRLLDGIRVSNGGKVTSTCVRIVSSPLSTLPRRRSKTRYSPPIFSTQWHGFSSSLQCEGNFSFGDRLSDMRRSSQPHISGLQSVSEEKDDVFEEGNSEGDQSDSLVFRTESGDQLCELNPESHDQLPESHDQQPESHDQQPGSHDQQPELHDQQPGSHDQQPESHDQQPESHDQQPELHDQLSESHDQQPDARSHDESHDHTDNVQMTDTQNAITSIHHTGTEVKLDRETKPEVPNHVTHETDAGMSLSQKPESDSTTVDVSNLSRQTETTVKLNQGAETSEHAAQEVEDSATQEIPENDGEAVEHSDFRRESGATQPTEVPCDSVSTKSSATDLTRDSGFFSTRSPTRQTGFTSMSSFTNEERSTQGSQDKKTQNRSFSTPSGKSERLSSDETVGKHHSERDKSSQRSLSSDGAGYYSMATGVGGSSVGFGKHKPRYSPPLSRGFVDDFRSKSSLSGRISTDSWMSRFWEDEPVFEVWAASSEAHRSVATVMEYNGRFLSVDDIEVGDSPILCMCVTRGDKVWMGFDIGYLMVFNAATRRPCAQAWIKQYTAILCIIHIAALKRVYVGLSDGSILAYNDDISSVVTCTTPARIKLIPLCEYVDPNQTSACLLAVPKIRPPQTNATSFEIWVGQREGRITILDAETLEVLKFISNPFDISKTPNFVAYLTYASLVCSVSSPSDQAGNGSAKSDAAVGRSGLEAAAPPQSCVSVYGALLHGQYVTMWNADSKKAVASFNCNTHMEKSEECSISALHYANLQLYVGLTNGKILVLDAVTFECVCTLSCHRSLISSLLTIDLAHLQQEQETSSVYRGDKRDSTGSTTPMSHSANPSPVPVGDKIPRSSSLSSIQSVSNTRQLLSFGTGFRSYYDGPESKPHLESGFLLLWDAEHWGGDI